MKNLGVNKLGQVDLCNYPLAQKLRMLAYQESYDIFAFKSCGGSCGDSNCS